MDSSLFLNVFIYGEIFVDKNVFLHVGVLLWTCVIAVVISGEYNISHKKL